MIDSLREIPGAQSPWPDCDRILDASERFAVETAQGKRILWAPRETARLAALLYSAQVHGLRIQVIGRGTYSDDSNADAFLSSRAMTRIDGEALGDALLRVEAGATIQDVDSYLFERGLELGWSDWIWRAAPTTLGSIWAREAHNGCLLSQRSPGSCIHKAEGVLWDGSLVQSTYPSKDWAAVTSFELRVVRRPAARRQWAWSSRNRTELWERIELLKAFTETWERLDLLLPCSDLEKGFVLAQVAGSEGELAGCPCWEGVETQDPLPGLRRFLQNYRPLTEPCSEGYAWKHLRTNKPWYLVS